LANIALIFIPANANGKVGLDFFEFAVNEVAQLGICFWGKFMSRIMFAKMEVWMVLLLSLAVIPVMILFGFLVLDGSTGGERFGKASLSAVGIAKIPDTLRDVISPRDRLQIWNSKRYDAKPTGWHTALAKMPQIDGYLLASRYDGSVKRHKLELISMQDWSVKHTWMPHAEHILEGASTASAFADYTAWNASLFREISPLLLANGDIIAKDHNAPLFRLDICGQRKWMNDGRIFHHSTEMDGDGHIWVPSVVEPHSVKALPPDFFEDQIVQLDLNGKILFARSVPKLMLDNQLEFLLFTNGMYNRDPTHLNDIEPVLDDGPFWKRGDVFLSLRNISTILLYRPTSDKIIWMKQGPWVAQHDVDILDDHRISVYDNHAQDRGYGPYFEGNSNILVYDFSNGAVSRPYSDLMKSENIRTSAAGLFTPLSKGYALIEDVQDARLLIAGPDNSLAAEFTNRAVDGNIYLLGWSRFVDKALGDRVVRLAKAAHCTA